MKFLVDAQLPVRLARFLQASGYDTLHTRDLPHTTWQFYEKNRAKRE